MSSSNAELSALAFEPSGAWLGSDGIWSGFTISVGTPPQNFTVLPATNAQHIYIPAADDCKRIPRFDCASSRGVGAFDNARSLGFQANASSTWKLIGLHEVGLNQNLAWSGNGVTGYETIGFGDDDKVPDRGKVMDGEVVTAYVTPDIWVGLLGLGGSSITYREGERVGSFISHLKEKRIIPSESFGYTAGASYRSTKIPASLTLGGYDQTRISTPITIPLSKDTANPVSLSLQKIVVSNSPNGTLSLLTDAILTPIDSSVPELWLPEPVCDRFASLFSLEYQNASGRYAISPSTREKLKELSPTFTFTVADSLVGGKSTNIDLPYAAFDLEATYPIFANATRYFPIRRAANDSQFAIGRAFLQEAYIAVDYERERFDIGQASFATPMPEPDIVTIRPANDTAELSSRIEKNEMSAGEIAGAAIGAVLAAGMLVAIVWYVFFRRRRGGHGDAESMGQEKSMKLRSESEVGGVMVGELPEYHGHSEVAGKDIAIEVSGKSIAYEMEGSSPIDNR
ncbi:unnamed protein product [Periconia digitata]|uniref:Peptidase A1 domain-containing protein n=1 Tax=Periconia digitata TaxID=1303443 RepID=A0A9W4UDT2_9PLEO|nr:unnamed protein product [Periconia digitata]